MSVAAVFVALRPGAGRERGFMRAIMTPEVANGTISAAEFDALAGDRRDRHSAVRHRPEDVSRRRERHALHAARDLANDLCVADGGESAQVAHSRAKITRLRDR